MDEEAIRSNCRSKEERNQSFVHSRWKKSEKTHSGPPEIEESALLDSSSAEELEESRRVGEDHFGEEGGVVRELGSDVGEVGIGEEFGDEA